MDGMVIFQVVMTSLGVGVPVGTLIYNAGSFGQRIKTLEEGHKECKKKRETEEADLCSRIEEIEKNEACQKGLRNGAKV